MQIMMPTSEEGMNVYDVDSGLGGLFTVSIVQKRDNGSVEVRIWHGEPMISGWKSYGLFDGKTFWTQECNLRNFRSLS